MSNTASSEASPERDAAREGKLPVQSFPLRVINRTACPARNPRRRYPSNFVSWTQFSPSGTASTSVASWTWGYRAISSTMALVEEWVRPRTGFAVTLSGFRSLCNAQPGLRNPGHSFHTPHFPPREEACRTREQLPGQEELPGCILGRAEPTHRLDPAAELAGCTFRKAIAGSLPNPATPSWQDFGISSGPPQRFFGKLVYQTPWHGRFRRPQV